LPAIVLVIIAIYFLGFYDFDIDYMGDKYFARPDVDLSNLENIKPTELLKP